MLYTEFCGEKVSRLGLGCMRLPSAKPGGPIDEETAYALVDAAHKNGVNYFDTAFRYHGGASETFIGKALKRYPRDSWYIASKMPGHMMGYRDGKLEFQGYLAGEKIESIASIFEEQLQKCGVEYFDFYLLHNVCETSYDFYTNGELDVVGYLLKQKAAGRIRHLGFSAHGHAETIAAFLDKFPNTFEFVQIQINYIDWKLQDAKAKYEAIASRGLQIISMESCRGGALAKLGAADEARLKAARPEESAAAWAFRYLMSKDSVRVILSGMSGLEQLEDNLKTFSLDKPLTGGELALLDEVRDGMLDMIPCTKCRYCCDVCPQGLDIPRLISMYSEAKRDGLNLLRFNIGKMQSGELPGACLGCGECARICPQSIDIPKVMSDFNEILERAAK